MLNGLDGLARINTQQIRGVDMRFSKQIGKIQYKLKYC